MCSIWLATKKMLIKPLWDAIAHPLEELNLGRLELPWPACSVVSASPRIKWSGLQFPVKGMYCSCRFNPNSWPWSGHVCWCCSLSTPPPSLPPCLKINEKNTLGWIVIKKKPGAVKCRWGCRGAWPPTRLVEMKVVQTLQKKSLPVS